MAQRYGRNQKRAHRERIAALERQESEARLRAQVAERKAASAMEDALRRYASQHGMLDAAVKEISYALGRALAPHLVEPAERILASRRDHSPLFDLSAHVRMDDMVTVLRGEIPPLRYHIAMV